MTRLGDPAAAPLCAPLTHTYSQLQSPAAKQPGAQRPTHRPWCTEHSERAYIRTKPPHPQDLEALDLGRRALAGDAQQLAVHKVLALQERSTCSGDVATNKRCCSRHACPPIRTAAHKPPAMQALPPMLCCPCPARHRTCSAGGSRRSMARRTSSSKGASGMRSEPCRHGREVADRQCAVGWGARQQLKGCIRVWGSSSM